MNYYLYKKKDLEYLHCDNKKSVMMSFVTTCFNRFYQLRQVYYKNVKKYSNNINVEFILIDFMGEDTKDIEEYIVTNLFKELQTGKLKYYKRSTPLHRFNVSSAKNISHFLANGKFIYQLDADNILDGNEYNILIQNVKKYGENIVIHQNDGEPQILHEMWKPYNLCDNCHSNELIWNGTTGRYCVNSDIFRKIGGLCEDFQGMGMEDIDLLLRCINVGCKYIHVNLTEPSMFIYNESDKSNNLLNTKIMFHNLSNKNFVNNKFKENINHYILFNITNYKILTCFSVLYKVDMFIDNLISDISCQSIFNNINFLLINLLETNSNNTNVKINNLRQFQNITIINERHDYGLYNMWNMCIKQSQTYFVSNMNPDDVRGKNWAYDQIINFEPSINLVTPKYIPINKIISHSNLTNILNPTVWFEQKCDIINSNGHYYGNNNYFNSKDMFQYVNNEIVSYCIPNCSPVWRKTIHEDDNYFNEEINGCYADFCVWLKAGNKTMFKQTNYKVGFYVNNNQLHRTQRNDKTLFASLVLKYGNIDYGKTILKKSLDLSQITHSYGAHHRFGWDNVKNVISSNFIHNNDGILLDLFCERTFYWNPIKQNKDYYHNKKWLGFIHSTYHNYKTFDNENSNLKYLLENTNFKKSLEKCLGLIVLSLENKEILDNYVKKNNFNIKIISMLHPCELSKETFKHNKSYRINHIGWHLRNFSSFSQLDFTNKRLIIPNVLEWCPDFFEKYVLKSCKEYNTTFDETIKIKSALQNKEYDELLQSELIFNNIISPSGSNLISECVSVCNPIILNRNKTFEEYLGVDYPMFYNDVKDVNNLITEENINKTVNYLLTIRDKYTYDNFIMIFNNFLKDVLIK